MNIALLTDFGLSDPYVAMMKAVMLRINPRANFIDITHGIERHNITQAALVLQKSFSYFPEGTIFVAVIDPGVGSQRRALAIRTKKYYFVGPDNGVLSLAASADGIVKAMRLENKKYFLPQISSTFHGRDIFAPVAASLSLHKGMRNFGTTVRAIKKLVVPKVEESGRALRGEVLWADRFGNLITNIDAGLFAGLIANKKFCATVHRKRVRRICECYAEAPSNEPFFISGSLSLLEVSLKCARAADYFSYRSGVACAVNITF